MVRVRENPNRYVMIITDNQMPYLTGIELANLIRAMEASMGSERIKIVLLSGDVIDGELEMFDDRLQKPFTKDQIERVLSRHLEM
jgi:CheY-like chemotaxis protein